MPTPPWTIGYASPALPFSPEELDLLAREEEIRIETRAADGTTIHRTIIWVVTDGPEVYIRSVRGAIARWYREAVGHPEVVLHAAGRAIPARAVAATDADSIARASAALERKYAGGGASTRAMVRAEVLDTTLRLEPV